MPASIVVPISLLVVGLLGIGISIPMLLGRIPRNPVYGLRTKLTLSSDEIWYPANRFAAKVLIAWGLINILVAIPALGMLPLSDRAQLLLCLAPLSIAPLCLWGIRRVKQKFGGHIAK